MMKKIISFFLLSVCFSMQVTAGTNNGLKDAFDELNYSLTVEWDQKDQAVFNTQSEKFTTELIKLQEAGLSNKDMMEFAITQIKDKALAKEIETTFSLVSINAMSPDEAQEHIKKAINKSYGQGASWSGVAVAGAIVFIIAIAAVLIVINKDKLTKEAEKCYMAYKCNEVCELGQPCRQVCGNECI